MMLRFCEEPTVVVYLTFSLSEGSTVIDSACSFRIYEEPNVVLVYLKCNLSELSIVTVSICSLVSMKNQMWYLSIGNVISTTKLLCYCCFIQ